uniref:Secreted protein n=1 Tax=Ananas comosus var. bracteatus TaxID=296719 RepID=A0A6V7PF14_ANACO|nr:unnamed protein product [Ananas comosus var. bracteatus]
MYRHCAHCFAKLRIARALSIVAGCAPKCEHGLRHIETCQRCFVFVGWMLTRWTPRRSGCMLDANRWVLRSEIGTVVHARTPQSPSSACGTHLEGRHVYMFSPPTPIISDVAGPSGTVCEKRT